MLEEKFPYTLIHKEFYAVIRTGFIRFTCHTTHIQIETRIGVEKLDIKTSSKQSMIF